MLKSIEATGHAGVLDGYSGRTSQAPEFGEWNLIYGWNASGKTTLSRVIALLEPNRSSRLPSGAYARFTVDGGSLDTRKEADQGVLHVRVFNRDFVDDNLSDHTSAPALFIIGSANIRLVSRITQLGRRHAKVAELYRAAQRQKEDAAKARDRQATDLATACGTALGIRAFRAPDLRSLAGHIVGNERDHLLNAGALEDAVSTARDRDEYTPVPSPLWQPPGRLPEAADIAVLLRATPKQQALQRLIENRALSDWVRAGLRFHEHGTQCAFCGHDAGEALNDYTKHFSDEYQQQHAAISAAILRLDQAEPRPSVPHEKEWMPGVRDRVKAVLAELEQWNESELQIRRVWRDQLQQKLASMDSSIEPLPASDRLGPIAAIATQLNALVQEHNEACRQAAVLRQAAADRVKRHFAARYVLDDEAVEGEAMLASAKDHLQRVERVGNRVRAALEAARTELQKTSVAAVEINALLRRILGNRVSVEQAEDGQLRFMRATAPATNLSDGEKTAVSLAYFLVSLKQHSNSLSDTIVFIDDPICSLDANHIYDVAYLLLRQLSDCKQLFISTHNSEFFNTIKQEWTERGDFKKRHKGYLMHRNGTRSELIALPSHLVKFRSDYHYVFHCLIQIQRSTSQDVDAYTHCPNLVRRFLEMYLGFRVPAAQGFQQKLSILIDDESVRDALARFADEGSHSQSTLRLLEYSDFSVMSRGMVGKVLDALQTKDPPHYAALIAAVG